MVADTSKKEIAKCYKFLVEDIKMKVERITSASLVRRFCVALGLGAREAKAAEEMARAAVPSEDGNRFAVLRALCVRCNLALPLRPQRRQIPPGLLARRVFQEVPGQLSPLRPQWWRSQIAVHAGPLQGFLPHTLAFVAGLQTLRCGRGTVSHRPQLLRRSSMPLAACLCSPALQGRLPR